MILNKNTFFMLNNRKIKKWIKQHNGEPPLFEDVCLSRDEIVYLMQIYAYLFKDLLNDPKFKKDMALYFDSIYDLTDKFNYLRILDYVMTRLLMLVQTDWQNKLWNIQTIYQNANYVFVRDRDNIPHLSFMLNKDQWPQFKTMFFKDKNKIDKEHLLDVANWLKDNEDKFLVWPGGDMMQPWTMFENGYDRNLDLSNISLDASLKKDRKNEFIKEDVIVRRR